MSKFIPFLEVTASGEQKIGKSPAGSVSIASDGVTGTVGHFTGETFFPHADGAIASGEMFTYDIGAGRVIGIDVTSGTGAISTAKV